LPVVLHLLFCMLARFFSLVGEEGYINTSVQRDREWVTRGLSGAGNMAPEAMRVDGNAEGSAIGGQRPRTWGSGMAPAVVGMHRGGAGIGNEKQFSGCCVAQLSASGYSPYGPSSSSLSISHQKAARVFRGHVRRAFGGRSHLPNFTERGESRRSRANSRLSLRSTVVLRAAVGDVSFDEGCERLKRDLTRILEDIATALVPTIASVNREACESRRARGTRRAAGRHRPGLCEGAGVFFFFVRGRGWWQEGESYKLCRRWKDALCPFSDMILILLFFVCLGPGCPFSRPHCSFIACCNLPVRCGWVSDLLSAGGLCFV
jgi:hypothetical protein